MPPAEEILTELLRKFADNQASDEEVMQLLRLLQAPGHETVLENFVLSLQSEARAEAMDYPVDWEGIWAKIQQRKERKAKLRKLGGWRRIAAVLLLGVGCWVVVRMVSEKSTDDGPQATVVTRDVQAPEGNRAVIQLADGRLIYLDSAGDGALVTLPNVVVRKLADGRIEYKTTDHSQRSTETVYNTITNPRGSKVIDMTLSDGSHVWLNAGSSLRYPVVFAGNERKVEITGEAYFEVAHNTAMPFYVSKGDMEVRVLGTHFNVNAYEDEKDIRVTLLEGSVEVKSQHSKVKIKPGEQAKVNTDNGQLTTDNRINLEEVMAWKNNRFYFNSAGIKEIMRQLERWYNVDVEYRDELSNHFTGIISREVPASEVFRMLQQTGTVHFEISGRKIIVSK